MLMSFKLPPADLPGDCDSAPSGTLSNCMAPSFLEESGLAAFWSLLEVEDIWLSSTTDGRCLNVLDLCRVPFT